MQFNLSQHPPCTRRLRAYALLSPYAIPPLALLAHPARLGGPGRGPQQPPTVAPVRLAAAFSATPNPRCSGRCCLLFSLKQTLSFREPPAPGRPFDLSRFVWERREGSADSAPLSLRPSPAPGRPSVGHLPRPQGARGSPFSSRSRWSAATPEGSVPGVAAATCALEKPLLD